MIDSRRLLYFYHVAKAGRFTAAEAILDVAQSAISRHIQQLETDLGVALLDRTGHGVNLTPYGAILYRHAEAILQDMAITVDEIEEARHQPALGSVSIAAPPTFMNTYMAEVVLAFTDACPGVRICIVEASTGAVYNHLASGDVDLAIVLQPTNTARLHLKKLASEELYVIAAATHPVAKQKFVPREQLRQLDILLPAALHGSRKILSDYLAVAGIPLWSQIEADSLPLTLELLRKRPVCAILPRITCDQQIASGTFIARPLRPSLSRTLYIASLRDRKPSESHRVLLETVIETVARRNMAS